jgi:glycosyltransferase involved in cell wall biosynthesis
MPEVKRFIEDAGLADSIHLPGWVTFEDLPAYYGLAGAFVHASTREPWGVVVNEAMAAGLPVIVSNRCGSAAELVREGRNGFAFEPEDMTRLAELLEKIAHQECDRASMGRASYDIIQGWTPRMYAESLRVAANVAVSNPVKKARLVDAALLAGLTKAQMNG